MSDYGRKNPFTQSTKFTGKKVHLGISGSVACYRSCDLLRALEKMGVRTTVTLTSGAMKFVSPMLFEALGASHVYKEMFADDADVFAHLEPGKNADVLLVAPATANIMAKIASGIADDLLSAQVVAHNGALVLAPAMNPRMWANKATVDNAALLRKRGCVLVEPDEGGTACGDSGKGRLAPLPEIFLHTLKALSPQDMAGLKILVTLGPTREPWDGVRFFSNPSSGLMGSALATAAWLRGATVTAICGPGTDIFIPRGIQRINVRTAREMFFEAKKLWPEMDMGMFSAAVADFAPVRPEEGDNIKIRKTSSPESITLELARNPDILATLASEKTDIQKVLGFAAEIAPDMNSLLPLARMKLQAKKANIIAANRVNADDGAFGSESNSMAVTDINGLEEIWGPQCKADVAWELCSWLLRL